jgi:predicted transcriptional regulator
MPETVILELDRLADRERMPRAVFVRRALCDLVERAGK